MARRMVYFFGKRAIIGINSKKSQSQTVRTVASISDEIESYIRELVGRAAGGTILIQRTDLAERFDCVPSQITYVLMTRFTPDRGYLVEGRRGGGGGIRVMRLAVGHEDLAHLLDGVEAIDQTRALDVVVRALEAGYLSDREAAVMQAALKRDVLQVDLPERDRIRARLLRAMLTTILRPEGAY